MAKAIFVAGHRFEPSKEGYGDHLDDLLEETTFLREDERFLQNKLFELLGRQVYKAYKKQEEKVDPGALVQIAVLIER